MPTLANPYAGFDPTQRAVGPDIPAGQPGLIAAKPGLPMQPISGSGGAPSYVNMNDPVQAAVWQAFQQKGITPRDQGDFQYWVDNINKTGGFSDAGNKSYWINRMAQSQGGAGDYGQGSSGAGGSAVGGQGASPTDIMSRDPGFMFRLNQGLQAIERSAAARGTLLTGGTLKGLQRYAQDYSSGEFQNVFNRNLSLAQLGENAAGQGAYVGAQYANSGANLITGAGNAGAAGTVGSANAINAGLQNAGGLAQWMSWLKNQPQVNTGTPQ